VEVDLFREPLLSGDTIVLSTDGMHGLLTDDEIAAIVSMHPLDVATRRLVDEANTRGGPDNITVVVAQVDSLEPTVSDVSIGTAAVASGPTTQPMARPLSPIGLRVAVLVFVLLISLAVSILVNNKPSPVPLLSSPTIVVTTTPIPTITVPATVIPTETR
jgi:protein phosphatase